MIPFILKVKPIGYVSAVCLLIAPVTITRADSEIVVAIRYLQAKGTSHSHLYLYREDGKLLRQLTNDDSGQDVDPIFAPNGEAIVFTREKTENTREFWSVEPRGTNLKKLGSAPDWYAATKTSPFFASVEEEEENQSSAESPGQSQSPSPAAAEIDQPQHQTSTALDATVQAQDRPPQNIKAPDDAGEIFWRKGKDATDPLNWVMWFRDAKDGKESEIGALRGFPSFEPLRLKQTNGSPFLFDGPLRMIFFSTHLNSSDGDTVEAFDFNQRKLICLSPNYATPVPLPAEAAFLTLTENRYVPIPGSPKVANCSFLERWNANPQVTCEQENDPPYCEAKAEVRYARKENAALCYGASMYRPGKDPAIITIRNGSN